MSTLRVYRDDTDAGGVVYYANYLRYLERGRTEYLRERGISLRGLQEQGYLFPVARLEIDYLSPALLDDLIRIETCPVEVGNASFTLRQRVLRVSDDRLLAESLVTLACIGPGKRVRRLPAEVLRAVQGGDVGPEPTGPAAGTTQPEQLSSGPRSDPD